MKEQVGWNLHCRRLLLLDENRTVGDRRQQPILKRFNQGVYWAGKPIGRQAEFHVACAVTPVAQDMERELDRLRQKIEAGADFVMSQPLWSMAQLLDFADRGKDRRHLACAVAQRLLDRRHGEADSLPQLE